MPSWDGQLAVGGQHLLGVDLGVVLGLVAEPPRRLDVPPPPGVAGDAVEDGVVQLGRRQARVHQAYDVARAKPRAEVPDDARPLDAGAHAQARDLHAVPVHVEPPQRLAEDLGQAVEAVRARRHVVADHRRPRREADRVVAAEEDDPADARTPGGLEDLVRALDVGPEDVLEARLVGDRRQVHDGVHSLQRSCHRLLVADVSHDGVLGALDRDAVEKAQLPAETRQPAAQERADPAPGSGHEHS